MIFLDVSLAMVASCLFASFARGWLFRSSLEALTLCGDPTPPPERERAIVDLPAAPGANVVTPRLDLFLVLLHVVDASPKAAVSTSAHRPESRSDRGWT